MKQIMLDLKRYVCYNGIASHRRTVHRSVGDRRIGSNHAGRLSDKMSSELGYAFLALPGIFLFGRYL